MNNINKEIEEMASKLEKSTKTPQEQVIDLIKSLGAEGLKAKLPTLSDDEKVVLKSALEEMTMKKAVSFDQEAQSAKVIENPITQTVIQEEIASDDADEKLVKPAAAAHSHQGSPTDGWQGQVIKACEDESTLDEIVAKAMDKCNDSGKVMSKLSGKGLDGKKVQGAIDKYKKKKEDMEKAEKMSKEKAKEKIMAMEEKEHGTKDPKKLVEAEKKEHMKKSEEIEKGQKINKEEDQVGDAPNLEGGKQMAKKSPAPNIEDNAKANKKNMTKSVSWEGEDRLLKANTQGRNFHFNVETFVTETLKQAPTEEVKKSETKKEDINDLIEKSMDCTWEDVNLKKGAEENAKAVNGKLVKSFDEVADMAAACGISQEEAKKILGM